MYRLAVPTEAQQKSSTCWHASALMIWRYSQSKSGRAGPMHSLSDKWTENNPITPPEFINLAKNVGLSPVANANNRKHTTVSLQSLLKVFGPIWCAGYWYGPGHIIVLTGIHKKTVFLNDPDGGKQKTGSLQWFNTKLAAQFSECMMIKNPFRY